jgi:hypothetical protein
METVSPTQTVSIGSFCSHWTVLCNNAYCCLNKSQTTLAITFGIKLSDTRICDQCPVWVGSLVGALGYRWIQGPRG